MNMQKFKKNNELDLDRGEILKELYSADHNYWTNESEKEPDDEIMNKLEWLSKTLQLSEFGVKMQYGSSQMGSFQKILFTGRQLCCIGSAFNALHSKRFRAAYHELCDFIDNYHKTMDEPINMHEKVLLKLAIDEFQRFKKKNMKVKVGDTLQAKADFQWLIKGENYPVTEITESEIRLGKGLHWPIDSVSEHFYLLKELE